VTKGKEKRGRYGDGCVYKNGRLYWLSWYVERRTADGTVTRERKFESSGSDDKKFAQRILRGKLQELGGRRRTEVDPQKITYLDVMDNFFNHCVAQGRRSIRSDRDGKPKLGTYPRLHDAFSGWRASEITVADLKRFRAEAKADDLSDATCNRYMATLRAAYRLAVKDGLITAAECPAYFPTVSEPNEARGALFVEDKWYEPLKKHLKEPLRSAFILCYNTGLRVHEMLRLKWRDLDVEARIINLPAESAKTGKSRLVFLPLEFKRKPGKPDELVFPLGNYRWRWYQACIAIKAGEWETTESGRKRYVGLLLRHCRHTFVRNASDTGLEEKRIMDITGHKTRSTFDRYNIGKKEDVQRSGDFLERSHKKRQGRL
jgi:integrase